MAWNPTSPCEPTGRSIVNGRQHWYWYVTGTSVGPTDEFYLEGVPDVYTITLVAAAAGASQTVNPALGLASGWSTTSIDHIVANDAAAQFVRNDCLVRVVGKDRRLYVRPGSSAAANITVMICLMEGH